MIKLKLVEIPSKYLVGCHDPKFNPPQEAIDKAKAGNYKLFSIEQAKHSQNQTKEIEQCNRNFLDIIKFQSKLIDG